MLWYKLDCIVGDLNNKCCLKELTLAACLFQIVILNCSRNSGASGAARVRIQKSGKISAALLKTCLIEIERNYLFWKMAESGTTSTILAVEQHVAADIINQDKYNNSEINIQNLESSFPHTSPCTSPHKRGPLTDLSQQELFFNSTNPIQLILQLNYNLILIP